MLEMFVALRFSIVDVCALSLRFDGTIVCVMCSLEI